MKVSGFSFIKNAIIYDYPVVEAIRSVLPLCDNFYVAVGKSEDDTRSLIQAIDPKKIIIIDTVCVEDQRSGGRVLAIETDKAFQAIPMESDWAFYIQGDEVLHEKYIPVIREAMIQNLDRTAVDGLLFDYKHFYGSYDYTGMASNWYRKEIRVVRNNKTIYSYKDAQGFRKNTNEKLHVSPVNACIYHYGWVKPPEAMQRKQENFHRYWHDNQWIDQNVVKAEEYNYRDNIDALQRFTESHPEVMKERIQNKNWQFEYDISFNSLSIKERMKNLIFRLFGIELGYKNYSII